LSASVTRFCSLGLGLALGGVFVYAGVQKHLAPYEFAEAVQVYQLLPPALVGLTAAVFPWLELITGAFLVIGFLLKAKAHLASGFGLPVAMTGNGGLTRRSCLLLIMLQLGLFLLVILITMARGLKIDCGCGLFTERQVGPGALLEDALLLGAAGWLYWREGRTGGREEGSLISI
jgi:putative oxidoreductase